MRPDGKYRLWFDCCACAQSNKATAWDNDGMKTRLQLVLVLAAAVAGGLRVLSVAGLLAETMRRIRDEESVSSLYVD